MANSTINPTLVKRIDQHFTEQNVRNVNIQPLDLKNFLGIIARITAKQTTEEGEVTLNYILKSAPATEALRKYAQIDRIFKKEIFVYEKLLPLYCKLSAEHQVYEPFVQIPKIHFTCNETLQEALIMDDMTSKGFQPWDFKNQLDVAHATFVMKTYGKLHALSYALREHKPEEYKRIAEYTKEKFNTNINVTVINNQQKTCCKKALDALNPAKDRRAIDIFKKFMEKPFDYHMQAMKMGAMGPYAVITHGDASLKNFLFKYDNSEDPSLPSDICMVDWQHCRSGSPAFDLSQFLFVFADKEFRKKYFEQMLKAYHYSLCCHLSEFGLDPEKILPYDILKMQMKRYSIFGLSLAIMMLHIVLGMDGEAVQLPAEANLADIDAMFDESVRNDAFYKGRIRDLINDFVGYGYFELIM